MKAMILAAGLGTRLRPVTEKWAKPAVPFLNVPLLYYSYSLLERTGVVDSLILNTHHLPDQIHALGQRLSREGVSVHFSDETQAPLGSGGGIKRAQNLLQDGGDFLVANGDEVILPHDPRIMQDLVAAHQSSHALATILVMTHPLVGTQFGGVWATAGGQVKGFGKDGSAFGAGLTGHHYIGVLVLNDRIFRYLPDGESNILYDGLARGIAAGERVQIKHGSFTWFETGNPVDYLRATTDALGLASSGTGEESRFLRQICARFTSPGTRFERSETSSALIGGTAIVSPEAQLQGSVVICDGAKVEGGQVKHSVVLQGALVKAGETVESELRL